MSKTITISDESFELIKEQLNEEERFDVNELKDFVGKKFFIRTVTYHLVGEVKKIVGNFFVLENASWIADSGRFMEAIKKGILNEVEPVGDALVNINSITDIFPWIHKLPSEQK
jgi:hypothetical protein